MTKIYASRYHDISCGHRVVGQGGKCEHLHGHNYRIHFKIEAESMLNEKGMVVDFSVIKSRLCDWLEKNWDHKLLIWVDDPWRDALLSLDPSVFSVPFNPTAEEMARYLLEYVGPTQLYGIPDIRLVEVIVEETRKCSASAILEY